MRLYKSKHNTIPEYSVQELVLPERFAIEYDANYTAWHVPFSNVDEAKGALKILEALTCCADEQLIQFANLIRISIEKELEQE